MPMTCTHTKKSVNFAPSSFGDNGPPSIGDHGDNLPEDLEDDVYEDMDDSTDDEPVAKTLTKRKRADSTKESKAQRRPPLDKSNPFKGMSKACMLSLIMFLRESMGKVQSIMGSDLSQYLLKIRALEKTVEQLEKDKADLEKEKAELLDRLNGPDSSGDLSGMQQFTPDTSVDMCT